MSITIKILLAIGLIGIAGTIASIILFIGLDIHPYDPIGKLPAYCFSVGTMSLASAGVVRIFQKTKT